MNVLLIGGGGREHALAKALAGSPSLTTLYCAPGNPGIFDVAERAKVNTADFEAVAAFCGAHAVELVVIGPEAPLADGMADALRHAGIAVFGPGKAAAQLESSKSFAKDFMQRHDIPTGIYQKFRADQRDEARKYLRSHPLPLVIKADGLAAGKGVIISTTYEEALEALDSMFNGIFGHAGDSVVVEEYLQGREASVFAICDGEHYAVLAPSQDHKRAYDGDTGPNTGGMGAYAPAPLVNESVMSAVQEQVIEPVLRGMRAEGMPFTGCLFCGLMIHEGQPSVVEFNVRFGDPEAQVVLAVLKADLARLLLSAAMGNLDTSAISSVAEGFACCVTLASEGYPGVYEKGKMISGLDRVEPDHAFVLQAGTAVQDDHLVTAGGRVLSVCGRGATLPEALQHAYQAVDLITFEGKMFRSDIGAKALS